MSTLTATPGDPLTPPDQGSDDRHSGRSRRGPLVIAVLVAFQLMVATDLTVANIALPSIQASLGIATVDLAWVINAYTLAFGGLLLLGGRIGDLLGHRRAFIIGVVIFTVASLLAGMATTPAMLLAMRVAQGAGSALAAPMGLALVTANFPAGAARDRAIGIYAASGGLGASVGLLLGGVLTDVASWRWTLWINVPVGIALALVTPRVLADGGRQQAKLDVAGAMTSTLGATSLVYGFLRASEDGWTDTWTLGSLAAAVGLLIAFVRIELRSPAPLTPMRLFLHRDRAAAYGMMMLLVATVMGSFFFLAQYLQETQAYSPFATGLAFLPLTVSFLALSGPVAQLAGRIGPRPVLVAGSATVLAGAVWLTQISAGTGYWTGIFGPLVLLGVGMSANVGTITVVAMTGVADEDTGAASGVVQVMQNFGMSIGLAVLVTVFDSASSNATPSGAASSVEAAAHATAEGVSAAYVVGAGFGLAAVLLALALRRRHPEQPAY